MAAREQDKQNIIQQLLQSVNAQVVQEAQKVIHDTLDSLNEELRAISVDIHEHPEVGMSEHHAHQVLTDFMESKGFTVTRKAFNIETAFTAEYSNGEGRRVGFCSEFDALPGIGHACGHNLIAITGVACALALKALLDKGLSKGKVILFGTPSEEPLDGKIQMLKNGAFRDQVDVCMMLHPTNGNSQYWPATAVQDVRVEFHGKPSHAGLAPWRGVNALDAIAQAWVNVGLLRQQLEPMDRVHGIITDGGKAVNVIPDYTAAHLYVRAKNVARVNALIPKVENCFRAAALATGCELKLTWRETGVCKNVEQNSILADTYTHYMDTTFGITHPSKEAQTLAVTGGSTDFGNVSYALPGIHPTFKIPTKTNPHTGEFRDAAKLPESQACALKACEGLAMVGAHVLLDSAFLTAAKNEYETCVPEEMR
ncbi:hypothetical protein BCR43DRAFT_524292 [Syncephalastrum racemosum]|uniref:Peptidase M20 domain-containing protein 2 n=1 Tax=Syncephalastrum racemosum TaxID=13706 RepID=A0A1X2HBH2_SYNRA|nr:hypothetical protein BCR43DRAFT_524292 [Syncephalastrum racemosum]